MIVTACCRALCKSCKGGLSLSGQQYLIRVFASCLGQVGATNSYSHVHVGKSTVQFHHLNGVNVLSLILWW